MNNRFVVLLIACVAIFLGLVFIAKKDSGAPSTNSEVTTSEHKQGAGTSGVTLVEFGDFQCPGCARYYPILKQVKEKYGDQITFQYRNFPLIASHPNAMSAHRAAEAASMQDKFWEMHDVLFERQEIWKDSKSASSVFRGYAEELGLNMEQYDTDIAKSSIGDIIQADLRAGKEIGVTGTPALVLDGKLLNTDTIRGIDDLYKLIDDAIAAKQQ